VALPTDLSRLGSGDFLGLRFREQAAARHQSLAWIPLGGRALAE
jgi:hypothetical protein